VTQGEIFLLLLMQFASLLVDRVQPHPLLQQSGGLASQNLSAVTYPLKNLTGIRMYTYTDQTVTHRAA